MPQPGKPLVIKQQSDCKYQNKAVTKYPREKDFQRSNIITHEYGTRRIILW